MPHPYAEVIILSPERETILCNRYPDLLPDPLIVNSREFSIWGFECGDGWFDLIDCALAMASAHCQIHECEPVVIHEVKEKYGTLSIIHSGGDAFVDGAINLAVALSPRICEVCGDRAPVRKLSLGNPRCIAHESI